MNRTPPFAVLRALRKEVGFGCPVQGCSRPYLTWHHLDPPWSVEQHHNPEGMIALCREHHDKADAGAYTVQQLHDLKRSIRIGRISGRFDGLRRDLFVVGGGFHRNPHGLLRFCGRPCIWFSHDEDNYILANISLASFFEECQFEITENFWISDNGVLDIECPLSRRKLRISQSNGDYISMDYSEIPDPDVFILRFPTLRSTLNRAMSRHQISFPITAMRFGLSVGDGELIVNDREIRLPNGNGVHDMIDFEFSGFWLTFHSCFDAKDLHIKQM